jgi:hypothetical protein
MQIHRRSILMNTTFLQELQSILGKGGVISGPTS